MALSFKLSVLKKTHIWTPFNVYICLNDALLFQNKENKILLPPPQKKKNKQTNKQNNNNKKQTKNPKTTRLKDTNGSDMSTRTSVCLYQQPVTWIFTRSGLSKLSDSDYKVIPSLKNYYLIIVVFSGTHFQGKK